MNSKERFTRNEVMAIPSPEYTKTWHPISHKEVINSLTAVLKNKGIKVVSETYSVKNHGNNIFGTFVLDIIKSGQNLMVGLRNSIMKTFAVGVCAGTHVIVCSNMQFKGDFIEFRKHTSGISYDELLEIEDRAIDQVIVQGKETVKWHEGLRKYALEAPKFKQITYDAMERGILAPNHFNKFLEAHTAELELVKSKTGTLYEFHGAVTRMNRDLNLFTIDSRTRELCDLCDIYMAA
jgi:hypothetical protein